MDSKALIHKILHEFHFLNCIRAYELFQERFQQPASLSLPHGAQGLPFDDEFEKARLHYMYYGPYSLYHMGGMLGQQPAAPYTQSFFPPPTHPFLAEEQPLARTAARVNSASERDPLCNRSQEERSYGPLRGRPPKEKRKLNPHRISPHLQQYLLETNNG
jgi:hypothetical protein